jgi:membrane fusion protein, multidrug efflux system
MMPIPISLAWVSADEEKIKENQMMWKSLATRSFLKALLLPAFMGLVLAPCFTACSKDATGTAKGEDPRKKMAVPVTVAAAVEKTVPVQLRAIGNVQAFSTVLVKAQVEGELMTVHFKEGQEVKTGDLLFTIDPRPHQAALREVEANLAKEKAKLETARKQVQRYGSVVSKGYVTEEKYDLIASDAAVLQASVKADEAAVENVRLKLAYCTIKSPIDGVTGGLRVHKGNVIKANDNDKPLVMINQIKPVYVAFSIPERNLPEIKKRMATGKLEVLATIPGEQGEPVQGELAFLENTVDTNTGSIQIKALFPNDNNLFWPGQFVNVVLTLTNLPNATVVPSQAIQTGQQGRYVFVVKPDLTVEYRPVSVSMNLENEVVITNGVTPGEKVVTDGQLRLAAGSLVKVVEGGSQ